MYKERNDSGSDDEYTLCFRAVDGLDYTNLYKNSFQWGYKILASEYNLIEHTFGYDDVAKKFEVHN